jgi:arsenite methyltransferase
MLEIEKFLAASARDLEGLSYYEMIAKLGLTSFNTQGVKPMDLIAEYAGISAPSSVLVIGCGTGGTAIHLAEKTGASVYGIDVAPESVRLAQERASSSTARGRLHFSLSDASDLPFGAEAFDAVITEYVAFFLPPSSFSGFFKALKPGGAMALAEMMKDPGVSAIADARILAAERSYSELTGHPFHLPTVDGYLRTLARSGFADIRLRHRFAEPGIRETARNEGGWKNLFKITMACLRLMRESPVIKRKFLQAGYVKNVLVKRKSTARYVFQGLITGRKP